MELDQIQNLDKHFKPWDGMPKTRFQGSKKKLLPRLWQVFNELEFNSCLDAFGGTGSVSFLLKQMKKQVTFNDIMPSNVIMAKALFSSQPLKLNEVLLTELFETDSKIARHHAIAENYAGIYFTDEENQQIDRFCGHVQLMNNSLLQSEAYYVLFQSLLSKRPYNLFHRANLGMRLKDVKRSFGNKVTWDRPILEHAKKYLNDLAQCRLRCSKEKEVKYMQGSAFEITASFDLVYIDTPYATSKGTQESNYFNFYHFLDGLLDYQQMSSKIQTQLKHKPYYQFNRSWHPRKGMEEAFSLLFKNFSKSQLVVSYRDDGYPSPDWLLRRLRETHRKVEKIELTNYKYALSTKKSQTKEIVLVAAPL